MKATRITILGIFAGILLSLFSPFAFASESGYGREMFYAPPEEQEIAYRATRKESFDYKKALDFYGLTVLKESIARVYLVNMLEYARTGKFNIEPLYDTAEGQEHWRVYTAKLVTAENEYAGNLRFSVDLENEVGDGHLLSSKIDTSQDDPHVFFSKYMESCSYVDHAARIQAALKESAPIPVDDVKYVICSGWGEFFFVKNDKHWGMIDIGRHDDDDPLGLLYDTDVVITESELLEQAEKLLEAYNFAMEQIAAWEKEHPGEPLPNFAGAGGAAPVVCRCSRVDNILNIHEFIENGMQFPTADGAAEEKDAPKENSTAETVENKDKDFSSLKIGIVCGITLLTGSVIFGIVRIHKRKKRI